MFTYKDGRFHLGSSSFALPDNCLVDVLLPLDSHNGFIISPLELSFQIYLDYWTSGHESKCGLERTVCEWVRPYKIREERLPCGIGWSLEYSDGHHFYHELYLPMKNAFLDDKGNVLNALGLDLTAETPGDLENALQNRVYLELLSSVQL